MQVAAGAAVQVDIDIAVADLARWDPDTTGTDLLGKQARGTYVVDGGVHELQVGQCIDSGVRHTCPLSSCLTQRCAS